MSVRAPQFYVINSSGQFGPYDLDGLREALRAGEIAAEDKVRSGMGTPLGTVLMVLEAKSRQVVRPAQRHSSDRVASSAPSATWYPMVIVAAVGCVVCGVLWLLMRGNGASAIVDSGAETPVEVPPVTQSSLSPSSPRQPLAHQPAPAAPSPRPLTSSGSTAAAGLVSSALGLGLFDDLGLSQVHWEDGAEIVNDAGSVWQLNYRGGGSWVGLMPRGYRWDISQALGLRLTLSGAAIPVRLKIMLYEVDYEAFSTHLDLPAHAPQTSYEMPWSRFIRDELQNPNAAADGFQGKELRYVSLINVMGAVRGVRLHGLSSLARPGSAAVPVSPVAVPAVVPTQAHEPLPVHASHALVSPRSAGAWLAGDGASIVDGPERSWAVSYSVPGSGWVGIIPDAGSQVVGASAGVALDVTAGVGACELFVQLVESDGESFVAPLSMADGAGRRTYAVRWSDFARDPNQKPGAANDGFAHAGLSYFALTVRSGSTQGLLLHRIDLIPGAGL